MQHESLPGQHQCAQHHNDSSRAHHDHVDGVHGCAVLSVVRLVWLPSDRLAGRSKKIQDVFVDAKIPRSDREGWPLVVRGNEVVAVPGIVEAEGVTATRVAD